MPKTEEKKSERQSWSQESMIKAVQDVIDGKMSCFRASKTYSIPLSTLKYKIKKAKNGAPVDEAARKSFGKSRTVFTEAQEKELVDYVLFMENSLYGVNLTDIRQLAYEIAERFSIDNNFNKEEKMAGRDWLQGFIKRHEADLPFLNKSAEKPKTTS